LSSHNGTRDGDGDRTEQWTADDTVPTTIDARELDAAASSRWHDTAVASPSRAPVTLAGFTRSPRSPTEGERKTEAERQRQRERERRFEFQRLRKATDESRSSVQRAAFGSTHSMIQGSTYLQGSTYR
jgi:hypothetical protein